MIFFTADLHLSHSNIIRYCHRPFADVQEMNEVLIANWNSRVQPKDFVYVLGDFVFGGDFKMTVNRLNGGIGLVVGDHDRLAKEIPGKVRLLGWMHVLCTPCSIALCHYSLRTWPKSHYNSWSLYGHSHGHLVPEGKSFDVGVDVDSRFAPYSLAEIEKIMETRPDNFNLVRKEEK